MASSAKSKKKPAKPAPAGETVDDFFDRLKHPLKPEIRAVRGIIRAVSPAITEEIKWNSLGFRTTESFATIHLRGSRDALQLVFHLGAKPRPDVKVMTIPDPAGLMNWLAKDRAMISLGMGKDIEANAPAFQEIARAWIRYV